MKQVTMESVKQRIAEASELRHRDGRDVVAERIYEQVVKPLQEQVRLLTEQRDAVVVENTIILKDRAEILKELDDTCVGIGMQRGEVTNNYPLPKIPAHDAAIAALRAEVLAEAIPDGYALVPQEMHLPAKSMEGICFHCGDGDHNFGEFTDGTLFVGEVDYGDGKKVYGLHIATADYPEEGCSTICEFARQLRESKGANHE